MASTTISDLNQQLQAARSKAAETNARQEFALDGGLRVRVYPAGAASFAYRYRMSGTGQQRTITLQPIGDRITRVDLDAADARHRELRAQRAAAVDPLAEREKARQKAAQEALELKRSAAERSFTVRSMAARYLDHASATKRSWKEDQRILNRYVLPAIGSMPAIDVAAVEVRRVLRELNHAPVQRDRVIACCRRMWNWLDPACPNPWKAEKIPVRAPRDRVLTAAELAALRERFLSEPGPMADIVQLLLLTGARSAEVSQARREEFSGPEWRIPRTRMKGGAAHVVLLSTQAQALVERILSGHGSEWLFPSPVTDRPLHKDQPYKWLVAPEGVAYTVHDLRRTMSTWLAEQLVPDAVIDRMLAHGRQGVNRSYIHARLATSARDAWQRWADHLAGVGTSTVVQLQPRGQA